MIAKLWRPDHLSSKDEARAEKIANGSIKRGRQQNDKVAANTGARTKNSSAGRVRIASLSGLDAQMERKGKVSASFVKHSDEKNNLRRDPFLNRSGITEDGLDANDRYKSTETQRPQENPFSGLPSRQPQSERAIELSKDRKNPFAQRGKEENSFSTDESRNLSKGNDPFEKKIDSQLNRLRAELDRESAGTGSSGFEPLRSEQIRRQVNVLMKHARDAAELGELEQAYEIALAAEEAADDVNLFFGFDEPNPSELVQQIQEIMDHERVRDDLGQSDSDQYPHQTNQQPLERQPPSTEFTEKSNFNDSQYVETTSRQAVRNNRVYSGMVVDSVSVPSRFSDEKQTPLDDENFEEKQTIIRKTPSHAFEGEIVPSRRRVESLKRRRSIRDESAALDSRRSESMDLWSTANRGASVADEKSANLRASIPGEFDESHDNHGYVTLLEMQPMTLSPIESAELIRPGILPISQTLTPIKLEEIEDTATVVSLAAVDWGKYDADPAVEAKTASSKSSTRYLSFIVGVACLITFAVWCGARVRMSVSPRSRRRTIHNLV